ncbi:MAG: DMT family transporter [Planctomycetota bacterium]
MPSDSKEEQKGILILGLAAFSFSLFSVFAKAVSPEISTSQLVLIRSAIIVPVLALWAFQRRQPLFGKKRFLLLLRGGLGSLGLFTFFYALRRLPLADTVLIFQAHPLLVALLAPWLLKERNRPVHWILLLISFAGVALIVGPTGAGDWEGRLSALICCVLAGFVYILVRFLRRSEPTLTVAFSFPAITLLLFGPPFLLHIPGFTWMPPSLQDWCYLFAMALFAAGGQVLMTLGLGKVPAARGTALSNLQVAFALIYGMVFFDEIPALYTLAGAAIIVCAQILLAATRVEKFDRCPTS